MKQRTIRNICVILGPILLVVAGMLCSMDSAEYDDIYNTAPSVLYPIGLGLLLLGVILTLVGSYLWVKLKGQPRVLTVLGLWAPLTYLVFALMEDKGRKL